MSFIVSGSLIKNLQENYEVQVFSGRSGSVLYRELNKETRIDGEMSIDPNERYILFGNELLFWNDGIGVTAVEKKRILDNVRSSITFLGFNPCIYE